MVLSQNLTKLIHAIISTLQLGVLVSHYSYSKSCLIFVATGFNVLYLILYFSTQSTFALCPESMQIDLRHIYAAITSNKYNP